ncbi:MAG: RagB/SusD family nutrient uptake outer membrane protein [Bacteroidales bacterium]
MKINILKSLTLIAAVSFATVSCIGNYEEINQDPYGVTDDEMQRDGYVIRASLSGMANGVISSDVNTTQFTECLLGGPMAGYMADANAGFSNTISNYNPTDNWTNVLMYSDRIIPVIYSNYRQLKRVTEDPVILSVAGIIKVAAMHRVTDTYGPIPYSQITDDGKIEVPYDSQQKVYETMFSELSAAITVLTENRTNNFASSADPVYGGVTEKWVKLANSLKLRLAMRISYADPALSKKMAEEAVSNEVGVMTSNSDNALITTFGTDGNPINVAVKYNKVPAHADGTACTTDAGDSHAAADIIAYMNGYKDPRRSAYFTKSEWEGVDYVGLRHGIVIPNHTSIGHKFSGVKITTSDPICWMRASEVAFLEAEAVAVFGYDMKGSAKDFYEKGVELSFDERGAKGVAAYLADAESKPQTYTDPSGSNTYSGMISDITIAWDEAATTEQKQERIITQKWIANWLLGDESWADVRRTGYPHLIPATDAGNKSNGEVNSADGARRMKYPVDEYVNNADNINQAVSNYLKGSDLMSTHLWFDCKK